jgi:type IV secretory pathway TrbD component
MVPSTEREHHMKEVRDLEEINGNILMVGIIILSVGVWITCSFGEGMVVLGVSLISASLYANGNK